MTVADWSSHLAAAKSATYTAASHASVPLHRIEFVSALTPGDYGISVWFFYETDANRDVAATNGWQRNLVERFRSELAERGYPRRWLREVRFALGSHETVVRDYESSYFYALG